MLTELIKAYVVGFCIAVPAGPVLLFVLQKTLRYGRFAGMSAGAGSAFMDAVYAVAGLFALSFVTGFIRDNEAIISIIGGIVIALIGVRMSRQNINSVQLKEKNNFSSSGFAFQAMGLVISNPGAIGAMMAALAIADLNSTDIEAPLWAVPVLVFAGEFSYWTLVSLLVDRFITVTSDKLSKLSFLSGIVIALLGVVLLIMGVVKSISLFP